LSKRLYRLVLSAYPRPFRERYRPLMEEAFTSELQSAVEHDGARGVAVLWFRTVLDTSSSLILEWLSAISCRSRSGPTIRKELPMAGNARRQRPGRGLTFDEQTAKKSVDSLAIASIMVLAIMVMNARCFAISRDNMSVPNWGFTTTHMTTEGGPAP